MQPKSKSEPENQIKNKSEILEIGCKLIRDEGKGKVGVVRHVSVRSPPCVRPLNVDPPTDTTAWRFFPNFILLYGSLGQHQ